MGSGACTRSLFFISVLSMYICPCVYIYVKIYKYVSIHTWIYIHNALASLVNRGPTRYTRKKRELPACARENSSADGTRPHREYEKYMAPSRVFARIIFQFYETGMSGRTIDSHVISYTANLYHIRVEIFMIYFKPHYWHLAKFLQQQGRVIFRNIF